MRVRTAGMPTSLAGETVLCIGARLGGEVRAFKSLGALGIGIDLNPGSGSLDVVAGDMEDVPFPPRTFSFVYTNVLDHVYRVDGLVAEVCRVLRPSGLLLAAVVGGGALDKYSPSGAISEKNLDVLKNSVTRVGLKHVQTTVTHDTMWHTGLNKDGRPRRPWRQNILTLYFRRPAPATFACSVLDSHRG